MLAVFKSEGHLLISANNEEIEMNYSYRPRPKPVREGEEHEVTIEAISRRGQGIARIEGFVIFVPETKIGEHARIRITQVGPRYATAERV